MNTWTTAYTQRCLVDELLQSGETCRLVKSHIVRLSLYSRHWVTSLLKSKLQLRYLQAASVPRTFMSIFRLYPSLHSGQLINYGGLASQIHSAEGGVSAHTQNNVKGLLGREQIKLAWPIMNTLRLAWHLCPDAVLTEPYITLDQSPYSTWYCRMTRIAIRARTFLWQSTRRQQNATTAVENISQTTRTIRYFAVCLRWQYYVDLTASSSCPFHRIPCIVLVHNGQL